MFGKQERPPLPRQPKKILQTSLLLEGVTAPELTEFFPAPVSLAVGLREFVLLEGLGVRPADLLLRLAATLRRPAGGRIFHWGRDLLALSRRDLYPWRRRLALVTPLQALLPRLTVLENVSLSQTLTSTQTARTVADRHRELLSWFGLREYLGHYPGDLPARQYHLALWARELIKEPALILGVQASRAEPSDVPDLSPWLLPWLENYHANRQGAVVLAGPVLEVAYALADRVLDCRGEVWQERPLPGRDHHPLSNYLDLFSF
jgi:ABC-type methionine transport system ATPase subunit